MGGNCYYTFIMYFGPSNTKMAKKIKSKNRKEKKTVRKSRYEQFCKK